MQKYLKVNKQYIVCKAYLKALIGQNRKHRKNKYVEMIGDYELF